jgi:hypothetical protein
MKHLLTAIACFFALSMSAQEGLPWNPNANNDNIIGTVDLLAMLNVYGEEYSVQTCFRGEIYRCDDEQGMSFMFYELPNDCGLVWTWRYGNGGGGRALRFPSNVSEGTTVRVRTKHQQMDTNQVLFQSENDSGDWVTFFSYGYGATGPPPERYTYKDVIKTSTGWTVASSNISEIIPTN